MNSRARARRIMEERCGRKLLRKEVVHHINGDAKDNDLSNLMLLSLSEHSRLHSVERAANGPMDEKIRQKLRDRSRERRPSAKLSIGDVYGIRKMLAKGVTQGVIAATYQVDRRTVNDINCGRSWSWA